MKHLLAAGAATLALAAMPGPAQAAGTLDIGVSMSRAEHQFLVKVTDAMQKEAKALGNVNLQIEDAQGDVARQLSQVQNFVAQGVDAIIVNAVRPEKVGVYLGIHNIFLVIPQLVAAICLGPLMLHMFGGNPVAALALAAVFLAAASLAALLVPPHRA